MPERISPDDPAFKKTLFRFRLRRGFIPWIDLKRNAFRKAFFDRYRWVNQYSRDASVLDVPCGMGWGTSLIENTSRLVGVDIDADSISEAQQRYGDVAEFCVGSMADLDFPDASFDLVVCLEGIEHVSMELGAAFIKEAERILKSEGALLVTSPHTSSGVHSGNPFHLHEYQTDELKELLENHFVVGSIDSHAVAKLTVDYFVCRKP